MRKCTLLIALMGCFVTGLFSQSKQFNSSATGNPILPGYFADPTVKKFGDRYFIYATTDGTGWGTGPSQVWTSYDFVNWSISDMNWPTTEVYWAPDVWQKGNQYYMFYSQPVQLHGAVSDTPYGPWTELTQNGSPIVPNRMVAMAITLDGQSFLDDDGSRYLYWGTWGIYKDHGCAWGKFNDDMMSFSDTSLIPNTDAKDFFEAPYVFKRDSIYYFTYSSGSCHDETYRVQYATSSSPTGHFQFADNNPILSTNVDGSIHGPGHHSILEQDGQYYMVYHRHDNPHSSNGFHRQLAVDRLDFDSLGRILPVKASHNGIGYLSANVNPFENRCLNAVHSVTSVYSDDFASKYALDENNGTLWMPNPTDPQPSLTIDLGQIGPVKRTRTSFQYATHYYQYLIEYSLDGVKWSVYVDKRNNTQSGSPMTDYNEVEARFLKLTITGIEKQGFPKAVWEFKAFAGYSQDPEQMLVQMEAQDLTPSAKQWSNHRAMYGGTTALGTFQMGQNAAGTWMKLDPKTKKVTLSKIPLGTNRAMNYTAILSWISDNATKRYASIGWEANNQRFSALLLDDKVISNTEKKKIEASLKSVLEMGELPKDIQLTSLKVINRSLHPSEVKYYGLLPYRQPVAAAVSTLGLLVDLNLENVEIGSVVTKFQNNGRATAVFQAMGKGVSVDMVAGRKAMIFDDRQVFISELEVPTVLAGNQPFTVEAWVYNPDIDPNECVLDWAPRGGQVLTSAQLQFGSNEAWGAVGHQGWADMGFGDLPPASNQWHHLVVVFDGYIEKVYLDGQKVNAEQKMLFVKPGDHFYLGNTSDGQVSFSGAISSLKMYDLPWSELELKQAFKAQSSISKPLLYLSPSKLGYGDWNKWPDQASTDKALIKQKGTAEVIFHKGQLCLKTSPQSIWEWQSDNIDFGSVPYTVQVKACDEGEWHDYRAIIDGNQIISFKDGVEGAGENILKAYGLLDLSGERKYSIKDAHIFSFLSILLGKSYSQITTATNQNEIEQKSASFSSDSKALNSVSAYLCATNFQSEESAMYLFLRDGKVLNQGWQSAISIIDHDLQPNKKYQYEYLARNQFGVLIGKSDPLVISTDGSNYNESFITFDQPLDQLLNRSELKIWESSHSGMTKMEIADGTLKMASKGSGFYGHLKRGALIYQEIEGDFVVEVEITDYEGYDVKKGISYNDPGLVVALPSATEKSDWDLISLSYFPLFNQGNMVTNQFGENRMQESNMSGWEANRFLQIERRGNLLFLRSSKNGTDWQNMPMSPMIRDDFQGKSLFVGLSQVTHSDNEAFATFDNYRVSIFKMEKN